MGCFGSAQAVVPYSRPLCFSMRAVRLLIHTVISDSDRLARAHSKHDAGGHEQGIDIQCPGSNYPF